MCQGRLGAQDVQGARALSRVMAQKRQSRQSRLASKCEGLTEGTPSGLEFSRQFRRALVPPSCAASVVSMVTPVLQDALRVPSSSVSVTRALCVSGVRDLVRQVFQKAARLESRPCGAVSAVCY